MRRIGLNKDGKYEEHIREINERWRYCLNILNGYFNSLIYKDIKKIHVILKSYFRFHTLYDELLFDFKHNEGVQDTREFEKYLEQKSPVSGEDMNLQSLKEKDKWLQSEINDVDNIIKRFRSYYDASSDLFILEAIKSILAKEKRHVKKRISEHFLNAKPRPSNYKGNLSPECIEKIRKKRFSDRFKRMSGKEFCQKIIAELDCIPFSWSSLERRLSKHHKELYKKPKE